MTPPLLQLYLLFFGLGGVAAVYGLGAFGAAALVLSAYAGAANASVFAEAADVAAGEGALAFTRAGIGRAFRLAYPAIMGSSVNAVKATGMASTIALPELVHASASIVAEKGNAFVMMTLLLAVYVVIVYSVVRGFEALGRRLERP